MRYSPNWVYWDYNDPTGLEEFTVNADREMQSSSRSKRRTNRLNTSVHLENEKKATVYNTWLIQTFESYIVCTICFWTPSLTQIQMEKHDARHGICYIK